MKKKGFISKTTAIYLIPFLLIFTFSQSCSSLKKPGENKKFSDLTQRFFEDCWKTHPGFATQVGLSGYDPIEIPDQKSRKKKIEFYKKYLSSFQAMDESQLSIGQIMDRKLILNRLERSLWSIEVFKTYEWNPAMYNIGGIIDSLLENKKRPMGDRLKDLSQSLLKVPEFYKAAQSNIKKPTKQHLNFAINQTQGLQKHLKSLLKKKFKESDFSSREKQVFNQRVLVAQKAVKNYLGFLKRILARPAKVGGFRSFRIGSKLYAQKFRFDLQIESSPMELYQKALLVKKEIHSKMFKTAMALYPEYYKTALPPKDRKKVIANVLRKVSQKHGGVGDFVDRIRQQIPELVEFVRKKNLLTLDPKKPLQVRETPLYQRGFAGASIDSPGPFDKDRETYYNVTPPDSMSPEDQKSYLREYNDYILQILNIHEAIPGHYVQQIYNNQSSSLARSLFSSYTTVEGWAVYAERMMLEQGYGNQSQKLWLMYYKWFLRVVTNTIIDYEIHNKALNRKQAFKLMMEDAFQEKAEAEGKWKRAKLSQVQLASYFAGFTEIYELRERIKTSKAQDFDLKEFHETFLSFGSAPVREIKRVMLKEL